MRKIFKPLLFALVLLVCMVFAQIGQAQAPPPPPAEKGSNSNKSPGGGAPIEEGLFISLSLVAGFGSRGISGGR